MPFSKIFELPPHVLSWLQLHVKWYQCQPHVDLQVAIAGLSSATIFPVNLLLQTKDILQFNVTLNDPSVKYTSNIKNVILSFTNQEARLGPIVANLNRTGEGKFAALGSYLSQPGEWELKVTVPRSGEYDLNHTFNVMAKDPTTNNTASPS
jgi:hypothetical protein